MAYPFISKNGELIAIDQAVLPVTNIEWTYGFGVYETIRVSQTVPQFLIQHIERLFHSATIIGLEHVFDSSNIECFVHELVQGINVDACNLKMLLIGGKTSVDATLYIIALAPVFPKTQWYRDGISVISFPYERFLPQAKTLNMLGSYLAYRKAKEHGCYDALLVDGEGYITEGSRTNFFVMKDHTIFSPPSKDILPGIMRMLMLHVAKKNGFIIKEHMIQLADVSSFDGAFLTSTSSKIMPISSIDGKKISIPKELTTLIRVFDDFLKTAKGVFNA